MNEAVFVASLGFWISAGAIAVIGLAGGAILYISENIAAKNRSAH